MHHRFAFMVIIIVWKKSVKLKCCKLCLSCVVYNKYRYFWALKWTFIWNMFSLEHRFYYFFKSKIRGLAFILKKNPSIWKVPRLNLCFKYPGYLFQFHPIKSNVLTAVKSSLRILKLFSTIINELALLCSFH